MEFKNRRFFLDSDDFDFVKCKTHKKADKRHDKTTTLDDIDEEDENLGEEQVKQYDEDEVYYEDDDDVDSENEDSLKCRPENSEIDKWMQAVEALSSRALKNYGVVFNDVDPVPLVEGLDPLPYSCFNCWEMDHFTKDCPEPKVNYCINCGRRGERVYTCPRCSRGQHQLFAEFGHDWRRWKTMINSGAVSGMKSGVKETKTPKPTDVPVRNFKSEKAEALGREAKLHREFPQKEGMTSTPQELRHLQTSPGEERKLPRRDEARAEKREVAVQTPRYFMPYCRSPKEAPATKEPISKINQDDETKTEKRDVVSVAVQAHRYFVPYFRSPVGEYQTVRDESMTRVSVAYAEKIEIPSGVYGSTRNNPQSGIKKEQPEVFDNNSKYCGDAGKETPRRSSLQLPRDLQQRSPSMTNEVHHDHSKSTEISLVEYSESLDSELNCRPVASSTILRCRESEADSLNPPEVPRSKCGSRSAKEEQSLEVTTDESELSETKSSEGGFRISSVDYFILLQEIKHLDRRFQEDKVIRDFSLMEINRILRNCSKI